MDPQLGLRHRNLTESRVSGTSVPSNQGLAVNLASLSKALLCLLGSAILVSCSPGAGSDRYPTTDEALAITTKAVQLAQQGRFDELCALGGGNCEVILDTAGRQEVPPLPPALKVGRTIPTTNQGSGQRTGGQVIVACGTGKEGPAYRTEMLVYFDQTNSLRVTEPVYWSGMGIAEGNATAPSPTTSGC